jgi:hypothetical protein
VLFSNKNFGFTGSFQKTCPVRKLRATSIPLIAPSNMMQI